MLVVEDERALAQIIADYLAKAGYRPIQRHTGRDGVHAAREFDPDLVVLDLGLPGLDGIEVCRQLRTFSDCYIIMVTARDDDVDKLIGLGVGADDYLTKPFSPRELVARAQAALRRPRASKLNDQQTGDLLRFSDLVIDVASREVLLHDRPVTLTRTEFDLLATMAAAPRRVFSRRQLLESVRGEGWGGDGHVVDVHIARLRGKLADDPGAPRFIETVRGIGYRFVADPCT